MTKQEAANPPYTLAAEKAAGRNGQVNGEIYALARVILKKMEKISTVENDLEKKTKMRITMFFNLPVFLRTTKEGAPFRGFMIMAEVKKLYSEVFELFEITKRNLVFVEICLCGLSRCLIIFFLESYGICLGI